MYVDTVNTFQDQKAMYNIIGIPYQEQDNTHFATAMSSTAAECPEQSATTLPLRTSTSLTRPSSVAASTTSRRPSPSQDSRVIPLPTLTECRET